MSHFIVQLTVYSNFCQKPVQCNMPITYDYSLLCSGEKTFLFTHFSFPDGIALVIRLISWRFSDTYLANRCFEQGVETIFEHEFLSHHVPRYLRSSLLTFFTRHATVEFVTRACRVSIGRHSWSGSIFCFHTMARDRETDEVQGTASRNGLAL